MNRILVAAIAAASPFFAASTVQAEAKSDFALAWSIYVGWMPWGYADDSGILDKWADKYGISIDVERLDYIPSIEQFTSGAFDAVTATNMDILAIPGFTNIDTTALIIGDYSNGNDAVLTRDGASLESLSGEEVNLVELSVSQYLLDRAMQMKGLADAIPVNTSDADLAALWAAGGTDAVVTWNPIVSELVDTGTATNVFDSAAIPGEIIDMLNVHTDVLTDNPDFGKALVGAWYEVMALMAEDSAEGAAAREAMGVDSGTDLAGYEAQLASTEMFYDGVGAVALAEDEGLKATMEIVHEWLLKVTPEDLLPLEPVGVAFPDGTTIGAAENVVLRFDSSFMKMYIEGML